MTESERYSRKTAEKADDRLRRGADDDSLRRGADDDKLRHAADDNKLRHAADDNRSRRRADDNRLQRGADDNRLQRGADDNPGQMNPKELRYRAEYRRGLAMVVALGVVRVVCGLVFVAGSRMLVDLAAARNPEKMALPAAIMIAAAALALLCSSVRGEKTAKIEVRMRCRMRCDLFDRILNDPWVGRDSLHSGDRINRLEEDVRIIAESRCRIRPGVAIDAIQAAAAFVFLWTLHPGMTAYIVGALAVAALMARRNLRKIKFATDRIRNMEGSEQALVQEAIQKRSLLLALGRTGGVQERLKTIQRGIRLETDRRSKLVRNTQAWTLAGFAVGTAVVFIRGASLIGQGAITVGTLTAFIQLAGLMQRPAVGIGQRIPALIRARASAQRIAALVKQSERRRCPTPAKPAPPAPSALGEKSDGAAGKRRGKTRRRGKRALRGVRFEGVTFAYAGGRGPVLEEFSHDFEPGSVTAVVGPSGGGKTTLARLIVGLLKPQSGNVAIYGAGSERRSIPAAEARDEVVYVPQGNSMVSGTVRENLLMAATVASRTEHGITKRIEWALRMAAAEFVAELPRGIDTPCGEAGEGLSEGQAQRIAIARALLGTGRIVLFDEFSSALDPKTERTIVGRIMARKSNKTLIIITHRPEVARMCDRIVHLPQSLRAVDRGASDVSDKSRNGQADRSREDQADRRRNGWEKSSA